MGSSASTASTSITGEASWDRKVYIGIAPTIIHVGSEGSYRLCRFSLSLSIYIYIISPTIISNQDRHFKQTLECHPLAIYLKQQIKGFSETTVGNS